MSPSLSHSPLSFLLFFHSLSTSVYWISQMRYNCQLQILLSFESLSSSISFLKILKNSVQVQLVPLLSSFISFFLRFLFASNSGPCCHFPSSSQHPAKTQDFFLFSFPFVWHSSNARRRFPFWVVSELEPSRSLQSRLIGRSMCGPHSVESTAEVDFEVGPLRQQTGRINWGLRPKDHLNGSISKLV